MSSQILNAAPLFLPVFPTLETDIVEQIALIDEKKKYGISQKANSENFGRLLSINICETQQG